MLDFVGKAIGAGLDYLNAKENRKAQLAQAHQNELNQLKFAKNAVSWKVGDAKRAGVHPLFALGASTSSFSPVSIGALPDSNFASSFGSMGADLSTALAKGMPKSGVGDSFTKAAQELQLENMKLNNDVLRAKLVSDVAKVSQPGAAAGILPELSPVQLDVDKEGKVTPLSALGTRIARDRGFSDGQTFEDRWGEFGGSIAGLGVMGADLARTARLWAARNSRVSRVPFSWWPKFEYKERR